MKRNKEEKRTHGGLPLKLMTAAAIMTMLSAVPVLASGWTQVDDDWYYTDSTGSYVTDSWKKSGDYYFYLGDDGSLVKSSLIDDGDDYYYVNSSGAMVTNQWVPIADTDDEDYGVSYRWYYFGSDGKAYTDSSSPETVGSGKYMFDEEGRMLFGFVDENGDMLTDDDAVLDAQWYLGTNDEGYMYTGWLQIDSLDDDTYEDYDQIWTYFNSSNGKKVSDTTKKINGYTYSFDENGIMQSGWTDSTTTSASGSTVSTATKYYSSSEDGSLKKSSWIYAIPDEDVNEDDYDDGTYRWFYANSSGYLVTDTTKKINGKWYAFDEDGIMQSGLLVMSESTVSSSGQSIVTDLDLDETTAEDIYALGDANDGDLNLFYFGASDSDGAMKKGTTVSIELEDDDYTFGFSSSGKAYNGIQSKKYYKYGILQKASSDSTYELIETTTEDSYVLVNTSGTVITSGYVKDADDNYYALNDGKIAYFTDSDLAKYAAAAYKSGNSTFTYSGTTYQTADYISLEVTRYGA